jgi:hypothetical protein
LPFGFGFERSKAWADRDGPWAVIFVLVCGFAMKIGYRVLLVRNRNIILFFIFSFTLELGPSVCHSILKSTIAYPLLV